MERVWYILMSWSIPLHQTYGEENGSWSSYLVWNVFVESVPSIFLSDAQWEEEDIWFNAKLVIIDDKGDTCFSFPSSADCRTTFLETYRASWNDALLVHDVYLRMYVNATDMELFKPLHVSTQLPSGGHALRECRHDVRDQYIRGICTCRTNPCVIALHHSPRDLPRAWSLCEIHEYYDLREDL